MQIYFVTTKHDITDIVYAEDENIAIEITKERCLEEQILTEEEIESSQFTVKAIAPTAVSSSFITWIMKSDRNNYLIHDLDKDIAHGLFKETCSTDIYFVLSDLDISAMVYADHMEDAIDIVRKKATLDTIYDKKKLDNISYSAYKLERFIVPILGSYHIGWAYKPGCNDFLKTAREHFSRIKLEEDEINNKAWALI